MGTSTRRVWISAGLVFLLAGCFSAGRGSPYQGDPEHLGWDELHEFESFDAYYVVRRLRPHWLNARRAGPVMVSPQSVGEWHIQVYVDGIHQPGGPEVLRSISVGDVPEMTHLDSSDATTVYGTDHTAGAIIVQTKGSEILPPRRS
jgi:hypothetical protein